MPDGEGYLLRPVGAQMCRYESLLDGSIDLFDIARMNDWLDVENENRARVAEWVDKNGR
jgi:hypothetical protein